ncbi:MAG: hypothetical protein UD936_04720 [Acutalibacteraceae bacterium]|nr:hypothetical protein [Acutalibacteraceae bacterium]
MERLYIFSGIILFVITAIIFNVVFTDENDYGIIVSLVAAIIVFGLSFLSSVVSKKLISRGSRIENKALKVLYYALFLPLATIVIFIAVWSAIHIIGTFFPSQGVMLMFLLVVAFICVALPCTQTWLVLILKRIIKSK